MVNLDECLHLNIDMLEECGVFNGQHRFLFKDERKITWRNPANGESVAAVKFKVDENGHYPVLMLGYAVYGKHIDLSLPLMPTSAGWRIVCPQCEQTAIELYLAPDAGWFVCAECVGGISMT